MNPTDVVVPDGYDVEVLLVGLSIPTTMGFADNGILHITEGARLGRPDRTWTHSGMASMDVCRSDEFGYRGKLLQCEWGMLAPMNSPDPKDLEHGLKVVAVDATNGTAEDFFRNGRPGPASALGTGGIERPVDCKLGPDVRGL